MRPMTAGLESLVNSGTMQLTLYARVTLDGGVWGAVDLRDDLTKDAQDYYGFGAALVLGVPSLALEGRPQNGSITFSGTDERAMFGIFAEDYRARPVEAGLMFIDPSTGELDEEWALMAGQASHIVGKTAAGSATEPGKDRDATVTAEVMSLGAMMARQGTRRRTDADQRKFRDADDGFFKDTAIVGVLPFNWGNAGANSPSAAQPRGDN